MRFQPKGIIPAMVTPLDENGELKEGALRKLTAHLIDGGVHGLFAVGSQGEFFSLRADQKRQIIETVVEEANGKVPVYAGTGAVTTREAIELTKIAESTGAQAVSVITPYFIKPNETELLEYYTAIARSTSLPVILYSNPARTGVSLSPDLVVRASKVDNIVGIKDSSGDLTLTGEYIRRTDEAFGVLAGRDTLIYATLVYGGKGSVTATANVAPKLVVEIYEAFVAGDHKRAREAQYRLAPLRLAFPFGTFPVVIKEALSMLGIDAGYAVKPVGNMTESNREKLREVLKGIGVLS
jgi:4-hydroxy-tetrahydrodipicolinate synthase